MNLDRQIRVNELLLQREEQFLRIHATETEIIRLLGGPYPFTRPALPSDRRPRKKPTAPRSAPAATSPSAALRRLADTEAAYRVTYRQFGRETIETHPEQTAIATLLAAQTPELRVLRLETIDAAGRRTALLLDVDHAATPSTPS